MMNTINRPKERVVFFVTMPSEKKGLTGAIVGTKTVIEAVAAQAEVCIVERRHSSIRVVRRSIRISAVISFVTDYISSLGALWVSLRRPYSGSTTLYLSAASSLGGTLRDIGAMLMSRLHSSGIRVVLHSRNGDFFYPNGALLHALRKWELGRADRVICLSRRLLPDHVALERLMRAEALGRISVVPNTIDNTLIATQKELRQKAQRNGPITVLYLSNFIPSKGYLLLAEAIRRVEQTGRLSEFRFIFRGNWPDSRMEGVLRSTLGEAVMSSSSVEIGGGIWDRAEVRKLLLSVDVFCLPTNYSAEAQPRSIIEAMACGCSIIATDHASIADMVISGKNGILVQPGSIDEIATYLLRTDRARISRQGMSSQEIFQERFTRSKHDAAIRDAVLWH